MEDDVKMLSGSSTTQVSTERSNEMEGSGDQLGQPTQNFEGGPQVK